LVLLTEDSIPFLEKNHFDSALEIFLQIEKRKETDVELFEKIAYCYQRMGDYKNALAYYKKADLFDTNKAWITKKIALCYRYLNEQKNALHYYKEAEELEPENLYIQAFIGHTLLRLKEYEKALKYYFKVEYLAPENTKIQGPIAWISFVLGKFDTAKKYYKKLLEKEQNINDTIYLGHVYWCSDNLSSAIQCYTQYVGTEKYNYDDIIEIFNESTDTLLKHGIDKIDLDLMKDYIIYSKE
jgi:tetratricopeptide (TPR) repeat protein